MESLLALIHEPDISKDYIKYVLSMAEDLQANVNFLYIQDPATYPTGSSALTGVATAQVQANLESLAKKAQQTLERQVGDLLGNTAGKIAVSTATETGMSVTGLERLIEDKNANMIIIESRENGNILGLQDFSLDIVGKIDYPVWVIPRKTTYRPFNEIIYATDYNKEDLPTLKELISLTRSFSPHITALHITDNADFELRIMKAGFQDMVKARTACDRVEVKSIIEKSDSDLGQLINDYASLIQAALIVVLKENRNFLERLFRPSPTKKIIKQSSIPVLVYHKNKQKKPW